MPIEVHCPNPGCARVHRVKDRYAGQRGKCPLCAHWMYVPGAVVAASPPARWPRRTVAACLALGMAGLAVLALAPLLSQPAIQATGDFAAALAAARPEGASPAQAGQVAALPLLACLLPLAALLSALVAARPGLLGLALTHLSVACASLLAFSALLHLGVEAGNAQRLEESIRLSRQAGKQGEAIVSGGLGLPAAAVGATAAAALFLLAAFASHRRSWSRVLSVVVLGTPLATGALWIFKERLGLGG